MLKERCWYLGDVLPRLAGGEGEAPDLADGVAAGRGQVSEELAAVGEEEAGRRLVRRRQPAEEVEHELAARVCVGGRDKGFGDR